jgi:glycosyltransferase involved in cell wall biosynthesis
VKRVLLVCADHVGPSMAGPGIRYYHFAKELSRRFDVTLMAPPGSEVDLEGITFVSAGNYRSRRFRRFALDFDAIVAQTLRAWTMRWLARTNVRVIYDLYDPLVIENLGFFAGQEIPAKAKQSGYRSTALLQEIALATGDAFVCASERQRDLWLGALGAGGRLDPTTYAQDPSLRDLIDVVPFGLEPTPPAPGRQVLKGVVDGIGEADKVLLWGGGVWNWFDPLTVIRAVARLAERRNDVKLYFLGVKHPNPMVEEMAMTNHAVQLAEELGLLNRSVFFNFGWVPYNERAGYLAEADLGVSSHFDNAESRFAFRTRILDYFWAELPVVVTRGDVLADVVQARKLGRTTDYKDVEGWVTAVEALLEDRAERELVRANIRAVRDEYKWPTVAERLARVCSTPGRRVRTDRNVAAMVVKYAWLGVLGLVQRRGLWTAFRETVGLLRRPRVP